MGLHLVVCPIFYFRDTKDMNNAENNRIERNNVLYGMLSLIDPSHSIIFNNEVGIIGCNMNKESNNDIVEIDGMSTTEVYHTIGRGKEFNVLTEEGIIFNEKISHVYLLYSSSKFIGYLFKLSRKQAVDAFDEFFGDISTIHAYIFYDSHELYVNKVKDKEILDKYKRCKVEELITLNSIRLNDKTYYGFDIDDSHIVSVMNSRI